MSARKQRLELTWIGKEERPRLEPRILLEDADQSYLAKVRVTDNDIFDNTLIHGDNLLALKALEQDYAGKVKCVFIDPPYNTGSAFEHYDDGVEHSLWLSLMRDRLEIIKRLLSSNGSLWITIDDNEAHYLKVLCDEVFGRQNFIATVIWRKNYSPKSSAQHFSVDQDYILIYGRDANSWVPNPMPRSEKQDAAYKNPDKDLRGIWKTSDLSARNPYSLGRYSITTPSGRVIDGPPNGRYWSISREKLLELDRDKRIWWGAKGDAIPQVKRFLTEVKQGIVPQTYWPYEEVGHTQDAKKESIALFGPTDVFSTPKPERLLSRIIQIATNPGDVILDSFAGSGTTGAVAQKMGRKWIMVELGEHCETHIIPRLVKVIDGTDKGGVTDTFDWQGGGGFRYYRLAPSLLEKDAWGNWVIAKSYDAAKLSQAVCKLMGFIYQPDEKHYWVQGRSSETDFIYVTTQNLTHQQLAAISEEVGETRTLLVCCKAFRADADDFPNLTIRKIPQAVLRKCEWGKDDYSLNVASLPEAPPGPDDSNTKQAAAPSKAQKKSICVGQDDLFSKGSGK
ncbi:adenine-specific DNA-methyltransferase [Nitrosospira sp. Nsp11]|uniref:site-specific DNA-methyltransferase n=1 Tax=Nitrosospira sp. Nsp11 TaxID=1855338 RepID=UPI00091F9CB7|nr:site-specific DNA-methyltransferase [Nitrosospira sp. Nsp11]SHL85640.1 adenine-specific DNA-methyltransferase [Nitrosospira sp. Nsp11]